MLLSPLCWINEAVVHKLPPNDIQGILAEAAKVLTQSNDLQTMHRLIASTHATQPDEWDKRLIATMLAKSGKIHEAELVTNDIEVLWQKAEAFWSMGKVLLDSGERNQALGFLHKGALAAAAGQDKGTNDEQLDAASVISDIAKTLDQANETELADEVRSMTKIER